MDYPQHILALAIAYYTCPDDDEETENAISALLADACRAAGVSGNAVLEWVLDHNPHVSADYDV